VIMASSQENAEQERLLALDLCERRVAGLIIVPTISDHGYLRDEIDRGIPVVFLDRPGEGIEADAVVIDNRGGGRAAIGALLASGHRRIAVLVDSLGIYTMQQRLLGVRDGLAEAGLTLPADYVVEGIHSPDEALAAVDTLLRLPEPPTAILCGNNRSTIGTVEALGRAGSDVEVVGFDDFEMARLLPRPVTIVDYDVDGMGRLAASRLFSRIEGDTSVIRQELLPTRLRTRGGWPKNG
jgi:LacI family transcriptional regulator